MPLIRIFNSLFVLGFCSVITSYCDVLTDIKPGEWYEVPNTKLSVLAPNPLPEGSWNGFKAVMESWSGAGFDSKRDRLIIWGGGHHDYSGNEIHGFDINKLSWSKLNPSSTDFTGDEKTGEYPDGLPRSRHTYDYIQYVPMLDAFCTFGGQGMFPSGQVGTPVTHCFDFTLNKWIRKNTGAIGSIGGLSAVDEATGKVWTHSSGNGAKLLEWDYTSDKWISHVNYDKGWFEYYYTAAAGAGKFIAIGPNAAGKGQMMVWNLAAPKSPPVITTIPDKVVITNSPGFVFDSKRNLFVAWAGGKRVFVLNPATMFWDEVQVASTNSVLPTTSEKNGTFGRFRYIASKDLFIGVNRTTDNVFFFRMPATIQLGIKKRHGIIQNKTMPTLVDSKGRFFQSSSQLAFRSLQRNISPLQSTEINTPAYEIPSSLSALPHP